MNVEIKSQIQALLLYALALSLTQYDISLHPTHQPLKILIVYHHLYIMLLNLVFDNINIHA